jgi:acyl carrier protein
MVEVEVVRITSGDEETIAYKPVECRAPRARHVRARVASPAATRYQTRTSYDRTIATDAEDLMTDDLERQVIEVIARKKKLDPATITGTTTFEQLGIDSLDAADLLFTFEDTFGIVVPDDAARSMKDVGQVTAGVRQLIAARAGTS